MRIGVPDLVSNSYFPAVAAVDLGAFEAEGIEAGIELVFPVTRALEMLRDGELDYVAGSAHAVLTVFPRWDGASLLAALARHMYWFLVLRSDLGVRRGDIKAVKGLRIGAAPGPRDGLEEMLREAGIDPGRDAVAIGPVPGATGSGVSFGVQAARALADGVIDGFWANGMGTEVAVRSGAGSVVLDVRRGDGPPAARGYTFPALVTTDRRIAEQPDEVAAAVRAVVAAQRMLKADPSRATEVGEKRFPAEEAGLIAGLIERDLPYYDPSISEEAVDRMNAFAQRIGLLDAPVPYAQVVATGFAGSWAS
ncbi:MAG: ABC transporter substrate-binding protein [Chloroflexota bacterium]|nr:ABC transporter substrate-binding protein [Chloroflexota bacterium]MDE2885158.1 ABC transporter substrate-binding protein [Chloroflexota bacterium]